MLPYHGKPNNFGPIERLSALYQPIRCFLDQIKVLLELQTSIAKQENSPPWVLCNLLYDRSGSLYFVGVHILLQGSFVGASTASPALVVPVAVLEG